jgi:O-antigen/teichoic acid export membrane protein
LTWFVPLLLSLAALPVIVRSLGVEDYGIYVLILGLIGYSFNFGIGRAITKYLAEYRVSGRSNEIRDVISATLILGTALGIVGIAVIYLLAEWLVADVLLIDPADQEKTVTGLYIAAAIIFVTIVNQAFGAILQGIHRFDLYTKFFSIHSVVLVAGNLALVLLGYGLVALLVWNFLAVLISTFIYAVAARRYLPEFGFTFRIRPGTVSLVAGFAASIVGYQIVWNLIVLFERAWLARKLGTESLSYYVVAMTIGVYIQAFTASLVLTVFPLASELTGNKDKLRRLYHKATKFVAVIIVFLAVIVTVGSREFLLLWMGEDFAVRAGSLLMVHTISFSLIAILGVSWQMKEGLGVPKYNLVVSTVGLLVAAPLMVYLIDDLGGYGVALGRLAGFAVMFLSILHFERWLFGHVQTAFWLTLAGQLAVAGAVAGLCQWLLLGFFAASWHSFLLSAVVGGVTYCITIWLLGFITEDEIQLLKQIRGRLN